MKDLNKKELKIVLGGETENKWICIDGTWMEITKFKEEKER